LPKVIKMMHNTYTVKNAAVTVRLSGILKRMLATRARQEHRSVSAQLVHELERAFAGQASTEKRKSPLGLFSGELVPTAKDFAEVRAMWSGHPRG
jgi:hypothetical protein